MALQRIALAGAGCAIAVALTGLGPDAAFAQAAKKGAAAPTPPSAAGGGPEPTLIGQFGPGARSSASRWPSRHR